MLKTQICVTRPQCVYIYIYIFGSYSRKLLVTYLLPGSSGWTSLYVTRPPAGTPKLVFRFQQWQKILFFSDVKASSWAKPDSYSVVPGGKAARA